MEKICPCLFCRSVTSNEPEIVLLQRLLSVEKTVNQTWSPAVVEASLPHQHRLLQTSCHRLDIDQAAKYIGAGAATVGVAGSGQ